MTPRKSVILTLVLAAIALGQPASAYAQAASTSPTVVDALLRDLGQVEEKLLALAEAIPEPSYSWRPAEGVRSVSEVLIHVAADNWFLPTVAGVAAPAETGIRSGDYPSVQAYEGRAMSRAAAIAAVRESFAHLRAAVQDTDDAMLARSLSIFGMEMTGLDLWLMTTTHLHEHLGQMIAYARSNSVVPPWSR